MGMEKSLGFVVSLKPLKLDSENFGYWKVMIKQAILSVDVEVWIAVEDGWSSPMFKDEKGDIVLKEKMKWTNEEKAKSKYNSQAILVIFNALSMEIFILVQGCVSAKEAWNFLEVLFEGTSSVRRTRQDNLASQFEKLHMTENESVANYSSRLNAIVQKAAVLGK
ncbi:PREDICTED: uncharacterized protein LOC104773615 [Camelina sativa]|uniref:Uncharacterized protein LOC104773615 n=1 Tax=Camelina sativa TaxID=90675 RepID=A0ABM0Y736_CAMSA|nr:PREDICTED: uncharacterized protein LOC104773615 [Camelina sativa]